MLRSKYDGSFRAVIFMIFHGEFDPGSGLTLAACLTHASRTDFNLRVKVSGARVSNAWIIYPLIGDNPSKGGLIPNDTVSTLEEQSKGVFGYRGFC